MLMRAGEAALLVGRLLTAKAVFIAVALLFEARSTFFCTEEELFLIDRGRMTISSADALRALPIAGADVRSTTWLMSRVRRTLLDADVVNLLAEGEALATVANRLPGDGKGDVAVVGVLDSAFCR
jgi:hypothetical protein